jgi:hypothetical protein
MITENRMKELALSLFKQESERDKQKKIGASDFSDPCEYHLAKKLLGVQMPEFKYYLGGKLGTATHEFLEKRIPISNFEQFPEFASAVIEQSIVLGELEGYGVIKSKPDLVLVDGAHLVDWKTTKRDKSKQLRDVIHGVGKDTKASADAAYSLKKYYAQAQIYAWGLNKNGIKIDSCSLVFVNRDGTNDADVWPWTFPYSEDFALAMWERLERIWSEVRNGKDVETFDKEAQCFSCNVLEEQNG